ncbi:GD15327 [Drosophila simulans]|uniref:GD15327 n=1 Tax=Drosophila simulans TaxID=7240 RepID=B4NS24_DROSI|nr:GD15327 [Drosophila simulans]
MTGLIKLIFAQGRREHECGTVKETGRSRAEGGQVSECRAKVSEVWTRGRTRGKGAVRASGDEKPEGFRRTNRHKRVEILGAKDKEPTGHKDRRSQWIVQTDRRGFCQRRRLRRSGFKADSGVSGRYRWFQDERCLTRDDTPVSHNILVPTGPTRRPRQGASGTKEARRYTRSAAGSSEVSTTL